MIGYNQNHFWFYQAPSTLWRWRRS